MAKHSAQPVKAEYYTDPRNDEFSSAQITPKTIDENYIYVDTSIRWKALRFLAYRLIAMPVAWGYCKIALHAAFRNREVLKQVKGKGCFVYGNHTQQVGDPFLPNVMLFPKSVYAPFEFEYSENDSALPVSEGLDMFLPLNKYSAPSKRMFSVL